MVPELIAVGSCANQLGARYQGFTLAESAADIEAVRTALGLGPITLYGDSYGTLLGQAYSVRSPSTLRSLLLFLGLPGQRSVLGTIYPAAMRALKLSCARSSSCRRDGRVSLREEASALCMGRRAAPPPCARSNPAHRRSAQWHARLPTRGSGPGRAANSISGTEPGGHRVPWRGKPDASITSPARGGPATATSTILHRNGHGGRVQ